jgi:hypothetical protein
MWSAAIALLIGIAVGRQIKRRRALESEWWRQNRAFLDHLREQGSGTKRKEADAKSGR